MKENTQDLEQKLAESKQQEYINIRMKEFDEIKKNFEGKCFGSNTFNVMAKSRYFSTVYYEKFFIKNNEIFVIKWIICGTKYPAFYKSETCAYQINTGIYENIEIINHLKNSEYIRANKPKPKLLFSF